MLERCSLVNPSINGNLVDVAKSTVSEVSLIRKGSIRSHITKRLRQNTPSLSDRLKCNNCSKVAPHLQNHPFVIRHLLYRSVPDTYKDPCAFPFCITCSVGL